MILLADSIASQKSKQNLVTPPTMQRDVKKRVPSHQLIRVTAPALQAEEWRRCQWWWGVLPLGSLRVPKNCWFLLVWSRESHQVSQHWPAGTAKRAWAREAVEGVGGAFFDGLNLCSHNFYWEVLGIRKLVHKAQVTHLCVPIISHKDCQTYDWDLIFGTIPAYSSCSIAELAL